MVRSDYKVEFRSAATIRAIAAACLAFDELARSGTFDITEFVETTLKSYCKSKKKRELRVHLFDRANIYDEPANVSFKGRFIVLHVDRKIWGDAKAGDEYARFVISHEIGHIVLHDHDAKAFSNDPTLRIQFRQKEYSAEWQAESFAEYFLAPDHAVARFADATLLSLMQGISIPLARKRLREYFSQFLVDAPCKMCGDYLVSYLQIGKKCLSCGSTQQA